MVAAPRCSASRWFGGAFATSLQEGLTILGWVALWRPSEMLMYEWRSLHRQAQLLAEPNPTNAAERSPP
jgi:hypothetical protein